MRENSLFITSTLHAETSSSSSSSLTSSSLSLHLLCSSFICIVYHESSFVPLVVLTVE